MGTARPIQKLKSGLAAPVPSADRHPTGVWRARAIVKTVSQNPVLPHNHDDVCDGRVFATREKSFNLPILGAMNELF